jgi:hypothetical protein
MNNAQPKKTKVEVTRKDYQDVSREYSHKDDYDMYYLHSVTDNASYISAISTGYIFHFQRRSN